MISPTHMLMNVHFSVLSGQKILQRNCELQKRERKILGDFWYFKNCKILYMKQNTELYFPIWIKETAECPKFIVRIRCCTPLPLICRFDGNWKRGRAGGIEEWFSHSRIMAVSRIWRGYDSKHVFVNRGFVRCSTFVSGHCITKCHYWCVSTALDVFCILDNLLIKRSTFVHNDGAEISHSNNAVSSKLTCTAKWQRHHRWCWTVRGGVEL